MHFMIHVGIKIVSHLLLLKNKENVHGTDLHQFSMLGEMEYLK